MSVQITPNFKLDEFLRSSVAKENFIDNYPYEQDVCRNITYVAHMLEIIRFNYGKPIYISSGYRCDELNNLVGGSPTSNHLTGLAVDINQGSEIENAFLFGLLLQLSDLLPINELINEQNYSWIHLSFHKL